MRGSVTDDVWHRLDPDAGRLRGHTRRRLVLAAAVATVAAVLFAVAWQAGAAVPRLAAQAGGSATSADRSSGRVDFEIDVTLRNENAAIPVRVLDAGRSGPGLELVDVHKFAPRSLAPGEDMFFTLRFRVRDCATVPDEPWPVPVVVQRPWGAQTIHLHLPTSVADDAPSWYSFSGRDPYAVEWQRYLADRGCSRVD